MDCFAALAMTGGTSVRRKTIKQAVAAGALEVGLRAAAVWSARRMRAIPGFRRVIVAQSDAVGMAHNRRTLRAARPVLAGAVVAGRERGTVWLRSRQHVMAVRRVATAVVDIALLAQRRLFCQAVGAVQLGDILGDHYAFRIPPRPLADAVTRIHGWLTVGGLGREISAPGLRAGARGLRQRLAVIVGPGETAEVAAVADANRGQEETGVGRLRLRGLNRNKRERGCRRETGEEPGESRHRILRLFLIRQPVDEPDTA